MIIQTKFTVNEVAQLTGMARETIYRYERLGMIQRNHAGGTRYGYAASEVDALIAWLSWRRVLEYRKHVYPRLKFYENLEEQSIELDLRTSPPILPSGIQPCPECGAGGCHLVLLDSGKYRLVDQFGTIHGRCKRFFLEEV